MKNWSLLACATGLIIACCLIVSANAQNIWQPGSGIEPIPTAELVEKSSQQIIGDVRGIYLRPFSEDGGTTVAYIAEIEVKETIRGEHSKPGMVVYLSFWIRSPTALKINPALDRGYSVHPRTSGLVQCYFNVEKDGVCTVVQPNGIEPYTAPSKSTE